MHRYKLTIEYDGTHYHGWQRQPDKPSIQGRLEEAIRDFCLHEVTVFGSGRTDAGVHALGQVAHVDLPKARPVFTINEALNHFLTDSGIAILNVEEVDEAFHARFSATQRHYVYRILNRRAPPTTQQGYVWHVVPELAVAPMQEAAKRLIGHHDFTSFRSVDCQSDSAEKTLDQVTVVQAGEMIEVQVSARSFLYNQVRIMVGTLARIGFGDWPPEIIDEIFAAKDRTKAGPTAPAGGLYFARVEYG